MSEEVQATVDEMKSEESFDLLAAVADVAYPVGETTVYLNGQLADVYNGLVRELDYLQGQESQSVGVDPEQAELEAQIAGLTEEIRKTALTFHMRGVAPAVRRAIAGKARAKFRTPKNADEVEAEEIAIANNQWTTNELIRHSIVKVVNAKGQVATKAYTNEEVQKLADTLIDSEFGKLDSLCARLTRSSQLFSESLDADFLPKPSADQ